MSQKTLNKIEKEFTVNANFNIYSSERESLFCYSVDGDSVLIPMGMWRLFLKSFPWTKDQYPKTLTKFTSKLFTKETDLEKHYRDQNIVAKEMIQKLEENHTVFLSAATGFGKCFHPDQKLILHTKSPEFQHNGGTILKRAGEIVVGDLLLGDDLLPREVTSIITGNDDMYEIKVLDRVVMRCNGDHILVLSDEWFVDPLKFIEMSVKDYLKLPLKSREGLRLVNRATCDRLGRDPEKIALANIKAQNKELLEPQDWKEWTRSEFHRYVSRLTVEINNDDSFPSFPETRLAFEFKDKELSPNLLECFLEASRRAGILIDHSSGTVKVIVGNQFPFEVISIGKGPYAGFTVNGTNRRFLLDNGIVTHNTTIGCYLAATMKVKTMVVCHIGKVKEQWVSSLEKKTTGKVQLVKKNSLDPKVDFYVIGPQRIPKIPKDQLSDIGLVIVDEAHLTIKAMMEALMSLQPLWLVGFSATPRRSDGLQKALEKAFGPKEDFIVRKEKKEFTVIKVETDFVPDVRNNFRQGKQTLDWTYAVTSLAINPNRIKFIIDRLVKILQNPNERLLVLTLRVEEGVMVARGLREKFDSGEWSVSSGGEEEPVFEAFSKKKGGIGGIIGIDTDGNVHKYKSIPEEASKYRVQLLGMKKGGTGYDDPTRTSGVLLDSVVDVEQYEGRVRMVDSTIYDFVDNFPTHEKHWSGRRRYFETKGAKIIIEQGKSPRARSRPRETVAVSKRMWT